MEKIQMVLAQAQLWVKVLRTLTRLSRLPSLSLTSGLAPIKKSSRVSFWFATQGK